MRIGIDIDGCCYPWTRAVNEAVAEKFGVTGLTDHTHWDYLKELLPPDQWAWVWSKVATDEVFGRRDLIYPGTKAAVQQLCDAHEVHFVTHRSPSGTTEATGRWLAYHFSGYDAVHVLHYEVSKAAVMGWDAFIEDKDTNVDELLRTGVRTFMPLRPWNASYVPPTGTEDLFTRYEHWEEVLECLT